MKFVTLLVVYLVLFHVNIKAQDVLFTSNNVTSTNSVKHDTSQALTSRLEITEKAALKSGVEQTQFGKKTSLQLLTSFDGLGESFTGPQGTAVLRNPSDNSLAVGLDHIVQTVNSRMAIFTKKR